MMHRRAFLAASTAAFVAPTVAAASPLKIALLGQALIEHALPPTAWPARDAIAAALQPFDVCFTNFETVIKGPRAGAPTRELATLHAATPAVIDTLKAVHVNVLSTSNNHAFDLNTGGILDTMDALKAAKLPFAGTGHTLDEAAQPAFVDTPHGPVAFICFASGKVREGGAATPTRAGVNEMRLTPEGAPHPEDAARILNAVRDARTRAKTIFAYQHNHYWEPEQVQVPRWQQAFARQCIDGGASGFVGHGVPLLQGIEVYRGAPIFYGLGNFIFQTEKAQGAYGPESWQSVIVDCAFANGKCTSAKFIPIALNEVGLNGPDDMKTRGAPSLATAAQAREILTRLQNLSAGFGTDVQINAQGEGWLKLAQ